MSKVILSSLAILICAIDGQARAQTTVYGEVGKWVVAKSGQDECLLMKGSDVSLFGLTLDKDGLYGVVFTIIKNGAVPSQIPVAINAMDIPFSKDVYRLTKNFVNVMNKEAERFYRARLTLAELENIKKRRIVTFTEMISSAGYSNISAAHTVTYDAKALELWQQCGDNLR